MAWHGTTESIDAGSQLTEPEKKMHRVPPRVRFLRSIGRRGKHFMGGWWAWEALAAAISVLATLTLLIVLVQIDGRPQSSLIFGGAAQISINTIIALISTIIRTSLSLTVMGALQQSPWNWFAQKQTAGRGDKSQPGRELRDMDVFGDAATNSWSSLVLIWRTKGRALASLGATITILSLGFDAFSQQVLTTQIININTNTNTSEGDAIGLNSTLPRAMQLPIIPVTNDALQTEQSQLPLQARASLLSSFLNSIPLPSSECPLGSCIWPTTPTLALCSSCTEVSDQIQRVGSASDEKHFLTYTLSSQGDNGIGSAFENSDSNLSIIIPRGSLSNQIEFDSGNISTVRTSSSLQNADFPTGPLSILDYYVLGIPPNNYDEFMKVWLGQPLLPEKIRPLIHAYKCNFAVCLQAYAAETVTGGTDQKLVSSWNRFKNATSNTSLEPEFAANFEPTDIPSTMNVQNSSEYKVDSTWGVGLMNALIAILEGTVTLDVVPDKNSTDPSPVPEIGYMRGTPDDELTELLWKSSNSTQTASSLANQVASGFTTYMRTALPSQDEAIYHPTGFTRETIVNVRWAWLTYPFGLLTAGHVFLLATIWQTKRRQVRPWKGQRVPLLLTSLDPLIEDIAMGGLNTRAGLEERVGRVRVLLDRDETGQMMLQRAIE